MKEKKVTKKAWVIVGEDDFLLVQNTPTMNCQMYCDPQGKVKPREYLAIFPCTITYSLPVKSK